MITKTIRMLLGLLFCLLLVSCGGAGGGKVFVANTGNVSGYVYAPVGGAARNAGAPAGYIAFQNATVSCSGKSTTTDSNGYYILTGIKTGAQTIFITKSGYATITKTINVTAGQTTIATEENSTEGVLTLSASGSVTITSTPNAATIYIDAISTELTTPQTLHGISPGSHTVSVSLAGYISPMPQEVNISTSGTSDVSFTLNPNTAALNVDDDAYLGIQTAPVTIVEFSDYYCPFSKRFNNETLPKIKANYIDTGKVRYIYRDLAMSTHSNASEAAECAGEQNKYWEMHDKLFEQGVSGGVDTFKQYAADIGLNTTNFNSCLDSGTMADEVENDVDEGHALGVFGTPTFLINNDKIVGAQSYEDFEEVIESYLN